MNTFTTKSTSRNSAVVSDIILRETETTRLIFRPVIVENPHNKKACVRGHFIFQKKKVSGNWEDYNDFSLSKLKDGEWVKNVFNPKSIIIIGSLELEKLENGKLKSFELFRYSNKDVDIITYDELFNKIEIFLSLL